MDYNTGKPVQPVGYKGGSVILLYICALFIMFAIYISWFFNQDVQNETTAIVLLVILGLIYIAAMIATAYEYHIFGSVMLLTTFIFTGILAATTGSKSKNSDGDYSFSSTGCCALTSGFVTSILLVAILFGTTVSPA